MRIRVPLTVSLLLITVMLGFSAFAWVNLPDTARIAVHFDINGVANGFADKPFGLLGLPGLALILTAVLAAIPRIEPRRFNLASSGKFYSTAWAGSIALVAATHAFIVLSALHIGVAGPRLILPVLGLLFMAIGNYMGKTRANFFAGIRTPWTLSSDYSWEKTHRLTGRLFVLAGAATIIAPFVLSMKPAFEITIASVLAASLIGIAASYVYWRRDPARHSGDGVPE